jgi:hypothetical protein
MYEIEIMAAKKHAYADKTPVERADEDEPACNL